MKSNDWRHKNVARYTPGNTKILYFFNCLLDGMYTREGIFCYLLGVAKLYNVLGGGYEYYNSIGSPESVHKVLMN